MANPNANANPMDIAIATMLNSNLKSCVTTAAHSACESSVPQVRQMYMQMVQDSIRRQEQLSNMLSQKGWYVAPQANQEAINILMPQLQAVTQGLGTNPNISAGGMQQGRNPQQQPYT